VSMNLSLLLSQLPISSLNSVRSSRLQHQKLELNSMGLMAVVVWRMWSSKGNEFGFRFHLLVLARTHPPLIMSRGELTVHCFHMIQQISV
jgi:hypothetical protein